MGLIKRDTFTVATDTALENHTSDVGSGWQGVDVGHFDVLAATDDIQIDAANVYSVIGDENPLVPDYFVECEATLGNLGGLDRIGINLRGQGGAAHHRTESDFYSFQVVGNAGWRLIRYDDGLPTILVQNATWVLDNGLDADDPIRLKATIYGTDPFVYFTLELDFNKDGAGFNGYFPVATPIDVTELRIVTAGNVGVYQGSALTRITYFNAEDESLPTASSIIRRRSPWTRQPPSTVEIARSNFHRDLLYAKNFANIYMPASITNVRPVIVGHVQRHSAEHTYGSFGYMSCAGVSSGYYDSAYTPPWAPGDDITLAILVRTTDGEANFISQYNSSSDIPYDWYTWDSKFTLQIGSGANDAAEFSGAPYNTIIDGNWHFASISSTLPNSSTETAELYIDGIFQGTDTQAQDPIGSPAPIAVGNAWNSYPTPVFTIDGDIAFAAVWRRRFTAIEHETLARKLWQRMFMPRIIFLPIAGTIGETIYLPPQTLIRYRKDARFL